jgi:ATP synthase protein I
VKQETVTTQVTAAVNDGWLKGGSLLNSVLAGALIGYLLDRWLGTDPWLVVTGVALGSFSGFVILWYSIKAMNDAEQRDH